MSRVIVHPLSAIQAPGGGQATFTDNFTRAGTGEWIGSDWYGLICGGYAQGGTGASLGGELIIAGNVLVLRNNVGAFNIQTMLIPRKLSPNMWGFAQHSQLTITAYADTWRGGCGVMLSQIQNGAGAGNGYLVNFNLDTNQCSINRADSGNAALTGNNAAAVGDTLAIDVIPSAASNNVRAYRNGTKIFDIVDNAAARPIATGMPGIYFIGTNNGTQATFSFFEGGQGLLS